MRNPCIHVLSGNISQIKADAIITAINSGGMWYGGIDRVIQNAAGDLFHSQAADALPAEDGAAIVAMGNKEHTAAFSNVVFVIDDLKRALHEVVYSGLQAASDAGFKTVSLPTIRMGVMLGVIEKSAEEAVNEMQIGVSEFIENNPSTTIKEISFVVYRDEKTLKLLGEAFAD